MKKNETPRWETAVLVGSFLLIWLWFYVRQSAYRSNSSLHWLWNAALLIAVVFLIAIFVRRLQRIMVALRGEHPARTGRPERN